MEGFLVTVLGLREGLGALPELARCLPELVVWLGWALASVGLVMFMPSGVSTPFRASRTRKESLGLNAVFNTVKVRFINGAGGASW